MVNQSKINDPRFWAKQEKSGSIGNIHGTVLNTLKNNERRLTCVNANGSAGILGKSIFNEKSGKYEPKLSGRPERYPYAGSNVMDVCIPYNFQIEAAPGIGRLVFRQGGTSAFYSSKEGRGEDDLRYANVAGVLVSEKRQKDQHGDICVDVVLFNEGRDKKLIEKAREFLKTKGVTKYIAFQS